MTDTLYGPHGRLGLASVSYDYVLLIVLWWARVDVISMCRQSSRSRTMYAVGTNAFPRQYYCRHLFLAVINSLQASSSLPVFHLSVDREDFYLYNILTTGSAVDCRYVCFVLKLKGHRSFVQQNPSALMKISDVLSILCCVSTKMIAWTEQFCVWFRKTVAHFRLTTTEDGRPLTTS